ncbi:hypothetical protein DL546_009734 [Coniochaeta pulveracea]|uniref:Uncharacterized protein n=1 Tax=Coniochaeta pulveracea TaxID=177199 RepID=A0A420YMD6_9PEZI|nr:hypothetical protein DL546_009734 [Coniochaeta pulveracea]
MVAATAIPATAPFDNAESRFDEALGLDSGCDVVGKESVGSSTAVTVTWDPSFAVVVISTVLRDEVPLDISAIVAVCGSVSVVVVINPGIEFPTGPVNVVLYLVEAGCRYVLHSCSYIFQTPVDVRQT